MNGKKTYIVAGISVLFAIAKALGLVNDNIVTLTPTELGLAGAGLAALRNAIQ